MATTDARAPRVRPPHAGDSAHPASPWRHLDVVLVGAMRRHRRRSGLLMVYSATRRHRAAAYDTSFLTKQSCSCARRRGAMATVTVVDYRQLARPRARRSTSAARAAHPRPLAARHGGRTGTQAWFQLGPFQLQPSEFAKLGLIIALAASWRRSSAASSTGAGSPSLLAVAGLPIGADHAAARPRHRARVRRHHRRDARRGRVAGRATSRCSPSLGVARRAVVLQLGRARRLPEGPAHRVRRQDERRRRPPATARTTSSRRDRHRHGRLLRQGPVQRHPDPARQRALPAHRLHLHGGGGGARASSARDAARRCYAMSSGASGGRAQLARDTSARWCASGVLAMLVFQVFENVGMTMGIMPITGIPLPVHVLRRLARPSRCSLAIGLVLNVHMRRFA